MQKVVLALFFCYIGVFMSCASLNYSQPDFNTPNSFVIDSFSVRGSLEDNIRLYNMTKKTGISFKVYLHDHKNDVWKEFGTGKLKGPGDTEFISSKLSGKLDNYRYFAIVALDGKNYKYNFYKKRNDLHIEITEK